MEEKKSIQINIFDKDIIEIRLNNEVIYKNKIDNNYIVFDIDVNNKVI